MLTSYNSYSYHMLTQQNVHLNECKWTNTETMKRHSINQLPSNFPWPIMLPPSLYFPYTLLQLSCHSVHRLGCMWYPSLVTSALGQIWSGLVYLFIHSVTRVTLDTSITFYNLYTTTQLIIYGHPHNTI